MNNSLNISTVLGSVLFSSVISSILVYICREWISSRLKQSIKHEYDAKLEGYKAGYNKFLTESEICFNWWHNEQANAIKEVYNDLADLHFCLYYLFLLETDKRWELVNIQQKEIVRNNLISTFTKNIEQSAQKWFRLKLFLEDLDNSKVKSFRIKTDELFTIYFNSITGKTIENLHNNGDHILAELNNIMEDLRHRFQNILQGQ